VEPFKFRLEQSKPAVEAAGGVIRFARKDSFPSLEGLAMASLILKPGGIRIPHWHPNANEMDYVISGKAAIALFGPTSEANPGGIIEHFVLEPGDISFLPQGWFHSIQNVGHGDLHILVIFNNPSPQDIGLSFGLGAMQVEVVAKVLGVSEETVREFNTHVDFIAPQ
jgi:oxalate decarboxylase